jgi:hypothetical protein
MNDSKQRERLMVSIPGQLKSWIYEQAAENCTSANAEVVRAIRERREREQREQQAAR